jgi:hypothetical protein
MKRFPAVVMFAALTFGVGATSPAHAQLTGTGSHLPNSPIVASFPAAGPTYVETQNTSLTGTWDATVAAAWQGTFTATGPLPAGSRPSGLSSYDFSGLPSGRLPTDSYFFINDLDSGSGGPEHLALKAYDSTHLVMMTPWLSSTLLGVAGTPLLTDMPGWDWNASTYTYSFDGGTVVGNPSITLALGNNQDIGFLDVSRDNSFSTFNIGAPVAVPEPSTWVLLAVGAAAILAFRRRRRGCLLSTAIAASRDDGGS